MKKNHLHESFVDGDEKHMQSDLFYFSKTTNSPDSHRRLENYREQRKLKRLLKYYFEYSDDSN